MVFKVSSGPPFRAVLWCLLSNLKRALRFALAQSPDSVLLSNRSYVLSSGNSDEEYQVIVANVDTLIPRQVP